MYHQERTNISSFKKVIPTYEMNHTSFESALMVYSEGVYQQKKESRSLKDVIDHHMEDIVEHSTLMQKSSNVDFSGQPCMKRQKISSRDVEHVRGMGT
jgi:predicted ATP-binding protein involved in virulence